MLDISPDILRKVRKHGRFFYTTREALEWLGISRPTLRKYTALLNIAARRKYGSKENFYTAIDLERIADLAAPPRELYRKRLDERLAALKNEAEKV